MDSKIPPIKPWVYHPDVSSSSLVASGMEIGLPPGTTTPRTPSQNSNKALPAIPIEAEDSTSTYGLSLEEKKRIKEAWAEVEPKSPLAIRNMPLQRVKDLPPPQSPRSSLETGTRSTPSSGSSRKIRQLTGLDLNIELVSPLFPLDNDESLLEPVSPADSDSSGSIYSQPGADYDAASDAEHPRQRDKVSSRAGIYVNPAYHGPNLLHMDQQTPRPLRHTDRPNPSSKLKNKRVIRPESRVEVNILRDIVFQEQQRLDMGYVEGYDQELKYLPTQTPASDMMSSEMSLVSMPLTILTKKESPQTSPKNSIFQNAAQAWSHGLSGLTSPRSSHSHYNEQSYQDEYSQPSSRNTRDSIPVSPVGYMESDHITLPPLPDTPLEPHQRRFGSGSGHPLKSPFPFSPDNKGAVDMPPYPTDQEPERKQRRRISRNIKNWSSSKSPEITSPGTKKGVRPDTPVTTIKNGASGFAVLGILPSPKALQRGNEWGQEVLERVGGNGRSGRREEMEVEKRRESLRGKIFVVGVPDQSPNGRVSEWL